jgi:hypothetical protein
MVAVDVILNRGYGRVILLVLLRGVDRNEITWTLNPRSRVQLPDSPPGISRRAGQGHALGRRFLLSRPYSMDNEVKCDRQLDDNPALSPSGTGGR